ncbi:Leucine-rich repeat domain containing protein [Aphelenchoides fujianensis]|nr:Leucine-rich repeat domain containing protein [Aphelenchoides fujianensis]
MRTNLLRLGCFFVLLGTSVRAGKSRVHLPDHDPNAEFVCKGELSEFPACSCNEAESEVVCQNAQFVDVHSFHYVNTFYHSIKKLSFIGNNFQDLPNAPLFGSYIHDDLQVLNISANYIVNLHNNALKGAPNIRTLDLSYNEIVLNQNCVDFLKPARKLQQLYLRRAFTSSVNRTVQFELMMEMFNRAELKQLKANLRQNMLKTIVANVSCLGGLDNLDLSRNHFHETSGGTSPTTCRPNRSPFGRNIFHCDCNSKEWIAWFRSTNTVREKTAFTCAKASPPKFVGSRMVEVPVNQLDCSHPLDSTAGGTTHGLSLCFLLALLISAFLR